MRDYNGFKQGFIFCFMLGCAVSIMWALGCASTAAPTTQPIVGNSAPLAHSAATTTGNAITDGEKSAGEVKGLLEKPSPTPSDIHSADAFNDDTITSLIAAKTSNDNATVLISKSDSENQTLQDQKKSLTDEIGVLKPKADKWDAYEKALADSWVYFRIGGKLRVAFWTVLWILVGISVVLVALDWATDGATGKAFGLLGKPLGWASDLLDWLVKLVAECIGYVIGHISASKAKTVAVVRTGVPV